MNYSIRILPGITGFSIQMVSAPGLNLHIFNRVDLKYFPERQKKANDSKPYRVR